MNRLKQALPWIITAVVVIFFGMRLLDLLMLWGIYGSFYQTFRNAGIPSDRLAGALSVICMVVVAMSLRIFIWKFLFHRTTQGTLLIGGVLAGWMLLMYFLSIPSEGEYFNPVTGQPRYVYGKDLAGKVDIFPIGYKYHPETGEPVSILTAEAIRNLVKEGAIKPSVGFKKHTTRSTYPAFRIVPEWSKSSLYENSIMRVASVFIDDETYLQLAVKNMGTKQSICLIKFEKSHSYLIEQDLQVTHHEIGNSIKYVDHISCGLFCIQDCKRILPDETLYFTVKLGGLNRETSLLRYYPVGFEPIDIYLER